MGWVAALWGLVGLSFILAMPMYRLGLVGVDALSFTLSWYHWLFLIVWCGFMAFGEGYRGFQQSFSPRAAARLVYLRANPTPLRVLLAPLFCMGFFHIERKRMIITYSVTLMIIVMVQLVGLLEQPWRGLVDLGVSLGLAWGLVSVLIFTVQAFTRSDYAYSPETP